MQDESSDTQGDTDAVQARLLDAVYELPMDAQRFADIVQFWHLHLAEASKSGEALRGTQRVQFEVHFARVEKLLTQLQEGDFRLQTTSNGDSEPHPRIVVDATRRINYANSAAGTLFGVQAGSRLEDTELPVTAIEGILLELASLTSADQLPTQKLLHTSVTGSTSPLVLLLERAPFPHESSSLQIRAVDIVWPIGLNTTLRVVFGLTDAEAQVVEGLGRGFDAKEIAAQRNTSITTVRNQLRSVFAKLGVHSQNELVRMALGLASMNVQQTDDTGQLHDAIDANAPFPRQTQRFLLRLDRHRQLDYSVYGDPHGIPCLFHHSEFFGDAATPAISRLFEQSGVCFITPARYCHGRTTECPSDKVPFECFASDVEHLLDHLGISKAVHISYVAGTMYALEFGRRYPERVAASVFIAPTFPASFLHDADDASRFHRILADVIYQKPLVMKFLVKSGLTFIRKFGLQRFLEEVARDRPADLAVVRNARTLAAMTQGAELCSAQGYKGFCSDYRSVMSDTLERMLAWNLPAEIITGAESLPHTKQLFQRACERNDMYHQVEVKGAGDYVFFSHPQSIVDAVHRAWRRRDTADRSQIPHTTAPS